MFGPRTSPACTSIALQVGRPERAFDRKFLPKRLQVGRWRADSSSVTENTTTGGNKMHRFPEKLESFDRDTRAALVDRAAWLKVDLANNEFGRPANSRDAVYSLYA